MTIGRDAMHYCANFMVDSVAFATDELESDLITKQVRHLDFEHLLGYLNETCLSTVYEASPTSLCLMTGGKNTCVSLERRLVDHCGYSLPQIQSTVDFLVLPYHSTSGVHNPHVWRKRIISCESLAAK